MQIRKHYSKKSYFITHGAVLAVLLALCILANVVTAKWDSALTDFFGTVGGTQTSAQAGDFTSHYGSEEEIRAAQQDFTRRVVAEGAVLLKNDDGALPLTAGARVSVFGLSSVNTKAGGTGSGEVEISSDTLGAALEDTVYLSRSNWAMMENNGLRCSTGDRTGISKTTDRAGTAGTLVMSERIRAELEQMGGDSVDIAALAAQPFPSKDDYVYGDTPETPVTLAQMKGKAYDDPTWEQLLNQTKRSRTTRCSEEGKTMDTRIMKKHPLISRRVATRDVLAFNILGYILLIAFALLCVIPFYLVIISSFQAENILVRELCHGRSREQRKSRARCYGDGPDRF